MASVDDIVKALGEDVRKLVKEQLKELLKSAAEDADAEIRETGDKISQWLLDRAGGKLSDAELEALLYSRDQTLRNYKNTLVIKARARVEKIAVGLVNLVLDKILGIAFGNP